MENFQAFLKVLAIRDFDLIKGISKLVSDYRAKEGYLKDNHALRAEAYRQAIKAVPEDTKLNKMGISQFYVNFANLLHEMGRIVESIELLNDAENVVAGFPMAIGNLEIKHNTLAYCLINEPHNLSKVKFMFNKGVVILTHTLDNAKNETIPLERFEDFADWEARMEQILFGSFIDTEEWTKREDVKEKYKEWAAKKNLSLIFINVAYLYGNIDDIHIPNMGLGYFDKDNGMEYYSWFNTIKQEYNIAMKTLKLIRCAIFYMIIGFNKEYITTINTLEEGQIFVPLTVDTYDMNRKA